MIAPVIMRQRARERSNELTHLRKLIREFNDGSVEGLHA